MTKLTKVCVDELPQNCFECPFGITSGSIKCTYLYNFSKPKEYFCKCYFTDKAMTGTKRNRYCPLEVEKNETN